MATELQHFLHKHRLVTPPPSEVTGYEKCRLCNRRIDADRDDMYGCRECNFFLHRSCSDIPRYIHYSLHPMHLLEIFQVEYEYEFDVYPDCYFCKQDIVYFGYKCRACDLNLHYKCAAESVFEPKDHDHSFINLKPTLFTCDACGLDEDTSKCISCVCSVCLLQVHQRCREIFPLSLGVRQIKHSHKLKLCYSFEIEFDYTNKFCKICSLKMNNVLCLYQCVDGCAYIAHASCATDKNYVIENSDHEETSDCGSHHDIVLQEADNEKLEPAETGDYGHDGVLLEAVDQNERQTEQQVITHFSHSHSLTFSDIYPNDEYDDAAICYGCVRPISVPFYTCDSEQCSFFLHKKCFELPKTIQGPIHQHPLALKDFSDLAMGEIIFSGYTCQACQVECNGFLYYCTKCHATFDVECTLFEATLNHESHKCTLSLVSTEFDDGNKCIACGSKFSDAFWCEECNFFLDLKCASLPSTVGHDCPTGTVWSIKPLKLTYVSIEHCGQYYCDLCGETRDKEHWLYYCGDCHDSIHIQCLLGDAKFMYGKSYNLDGHCHALLVVKKPKANISCDTCEGPCDDSPVAFCPTCKVYFHADFDCCSMNRYRKIPIKNYCCDTSSSTAKIEDEEDDDQEIMVERANYHFGHPHSLIIGEYDQERLWKEVCDGCVMPISAPFYTCADEKGKSCNFFLHKECFELPKQIQHPFHADHPLVLKSLLDWPENDEGGFTCYSCEVFSNGFVYTCLECEFLLDVRCSLLSDGTIAHESPQCTLTLINRNIQPAESSDSGSEEVNRKCSACNTDCSSYRCVCEECDFEIGLQCALLPKVNLHRCRPYAHKKRPQHIKYASTEGQCYTCLDHLSENEWYYYCEDCKETTHARCTSIKNNLIKRGSVYRAYNHFHQLITMYITRFHQDCSVCFVSMEDPGPGLYCAECKKYFHFKCCRGLQRVLQDSPVGGSELPGDPYWDSE